MGPYKPLRNWVDEFIRYYMEIMGVDRPWHYFLHEASNTSSYQPMVRTIIHPTFGVPKMEVLKAYVSETPKQSYKVQYLHF